MEGKTEGHAPDYTRGTEIASQLQDKTLEDSDEHS